MMDLFNLFLSGVQKQFSGTQKPLSLDEEDLKAIKAGGSMAQDPSGAVDAEGVNHVQRLHELFQTVSSVAEDMPGKMNAQRVQAQTDADYDRAAQEMAKMIGYAQMQQDRMRQRSARGRMGGSNG
jgi:hypothetical protein